MLKYFIVILFVFSVSTLAEDRITIFVNESSYVLKDNNEELDSESLLIVLKQRKVQSVLLVVDVCAGPVIIANAYVALSKLKVISIDFKAVGKLEKASCKNI